jgi:hypothetical protein
MLQCRIKNVAGSTRRTALRCQVDHTPYTGAGGHALLSGTTVLTADADVAHCAVCACTRSFAKLPALFSPGLSASQRFVSVHDVYVDV